MLSLAPTLPENCSWRPETRLKTCASLKNSIFLLLGEDTVSSNKMSLFSGPLLGPFYCKRLAKPPKREKI